MNENRYDFTVVEFGDGWNVIDVFGQVMVECRTTQGARGWIAGFQVGFKEGISEPATRQPD